MGDVGLGFSEIWIPGVEKGAYFASPSLILHYIEEHDYCPPQMYSEAVMAVDLEVGYKAQEVYVGRSWGGTCAVCGKPRFCQQ
ncbi:hypothetical protein, partial [Pseudomonas aeruginosa]|uniref:DUF7919 family protein n=1 Tax=Pseudomonas aeruginosa TaxID=287 RepID=UPI0031B70F00